MMVLSDEGRVKIVPKIKTFPKLCNR